MPHSPQAQDRRLLRILLARVGALLAGTGPGRLLQRLSQDPIRNATEITLDAERKLGEILKATPRNQGAAAGGKKDGPRGDYVEPRDETPTLAELQNPGDTTVGGATFGASLNWCQREISR